jgi:hypothetical protein
MAKLCRITTVYVGGGLRLVSLPKKNGLNHRLSFQKKAGDYLTQILEGVLRRTPAGNSRSGMRFVPEAG